MNRRMIFVALLIALLTTGLLSACAPSGSQASADGGLKMAHLSDMPAEVRQSSVTVQDAYRFNVANPDIMKQIPCYCGCGDMGHTSNYSCYVKSDTDGEIVVDQHALGCSICVDITVDTMRMVKEGKPVAEIKTIIDQTYGQFGPSNINP